MHKEVIPVRNHRKTLASERKKAFRTPKCRERLKELHNEVSKAVRIANKGK